MTVIVAGIDVGARELVVKVKGASVSKQMTVPNQISGFNDLKKRFKKWKVQHVVLEATGVYHLDLALFLHDMRGLEVMVLNPRAARHFALARMTRNKTDAVDADVLAEFGRCMPFEAWQPPTQAVLALRASSRRLATLAHQRTRAKNQYHALLSTQSTPDFILEDVELTLDQLDRQIARLEEKTLELIKEDDALSRAFELLLSIKGVGMKSAIQLLGELLVLPEDMRAKQWVAMAGLDPRHHQSGSSIEKKARISKAGNRYLRTALYMPALSASRHVPEVKGYYEHLVKDRGLKKIQAICAVMRKLLHAIHGMWRSDAPFQAERFYNLPQKAEA